MNTSKNTWVGQKRLAVVLHGLQGKCLSNELCFMHGFLQEICYRLCDRQEVLLRMILPSNAIILDFPPPKKRKERFELKPTVRNKRFLIQTAL